MGLLRVFRSKSVYPISIVGSGIDPSRSIQVSGLRSVLLGLMLGVSKIKLLLDSITAKILIFMLCSMILGIPNLIIKLS